MNRPGIVLSWLVGDILAMACLVAYYRSRLPGYRGSIGFRNQGTSELDFVQLTGFSGPIECRSSRPPNLDWCVDFDAGRSTHL